MSDYKYSLRFFHTHPSFFIQNNYNLIATLINGAGAGIGFTLAIVLFAGIRERLELADIPEAFQGFPITLIAASLMSIAFLGFTGLIKL